MNRRSFLAALAAGFMIGPDGLWKPKRYVNGTDSEDFQFNSEEWRPLLCSAAEISGRLLVLELHRAGYLETRTAAGILLQRRGHLGLHPPLSVVHVDPWPWDREQTSGGAVI